jgi:hypothetical protein
VPQYSSIIHKIYLLCPRSDDKISVGKEHSHISCPSTNKVPSTMYEIICYLHKKYELTCCVYLDNSLQTISVKYKGGDEGLSV